MLGSLTGQMYKKGLLESEVKFYYKGCNVQDLTKSVQSFVAPKWRPAAFNGPGGYAIHQCPHSFFLYRVAQAIQWKGSN